MQVYLGMCLGPCMFVRIIEMSVLRKSSIRGSTVWWVWLNCLLSGFSSTGSVQLGMDYCPLYGVAGCPLFRGF